MNPARSLGPAIATQNFHKIFIYLISPVVGTVAAVILYHISFGHQQPRRTSCIGSKRIEPVDSVINPYKAQFPQNQTSPSSDERWREMASATVTIVRKDSNFTVTFDETYEITTTVTSSGADVEAWITETREIYRCRPSHFVVGIDAKWCPSSNENRVAVLSLCVRRRCLIYHIIHAAMDDGVPHALADFLFDNDFTFTGVEIEAVNNSILKDHRLGVNKAVDLRDLAMEKTHRKEMKQMGLAELADQTMGIRFHKPTRATISSWDDDELTDDQVAYASVDAFLSAEIGRRLSAF